MFTGIIESVGKIVDIRQEGTNSHFVIDSPLGRELTIDQSLAHEGVCLTVTHVEGNRHWVTAIDETLRKSNIGHWTTGRKVNLERCMPANGRFDGHIVQGHVDGQASVEDIKEMAGSWIFTFQCNTGLMVEKGSICINGTSLTCYDITEGVFKVSIIPYTYEYTTFNELRAGDAVNIEYDIIGKYLKKFTGS